MPPLLERLLSPELYDTLVADHSAEMWLVGGAVRDHFLNRPEPDLDFAVAGEARRLARRIADRLEGAYFSLDDERDAGRVILPTGGRTLDFVRLQGKSIEHDLQQRDFTLNAMAFPLRGSEQLIDELGGLQDLKDKLLRACGPDAIASDPVRALRGVRLATELNLRIEPSTQDQIRQAADQLASAAVERLRDELVRILRPGLAPSAVRLLHRLGLLAALIPEAVQDGEQPEQSFATLGCLSDLLGTISGEGRAENLITAELALKLGRFRTPLAEHLGRPVTGGLQSTQLLILSGLLAHLERAHIRHRLQELRFSRRANESVQRIVLGLAELPTIAASEGLAPLAAYRYFRSAAAEGVEACLLFLASGLAAQAGPPDQQIWEQRLTSVQKILEVWFEKRSEVLEPPVLLRGDELAGALGLPAGPQIGQLLEQVREAQVAGRVSTPTEALDFARQLHTGGEAAEAREKSQ